MQKEERKIVFLKEKVWKHSENISMNWNLTMFSLSISRVEGKMGERMDEILRTARKCLYQFFLLF